MKLRYTAPALFDLNSILDYIASQSPIGSKRVLGRVQALIDLLLIHPYIGNRTDDPSIRRPIITPYRYLIFYEATKAEVIFTRSVTPLATPRICPELPFKNELETPPQSGMVIDRPMSSLLPCRTAP